MVLDWGLRKAASKLWKHGSRLDDAVSVLEEDGARMQRDEEADEERWVTLGVDALGRTLVVAYTWRGKNIRIISARQATPKESRYYLENL